MFTTVEEITKKYNITIDEKYKEYKDILLDIFNDNFPIEKVNFTDGNILYLIGLNYDCSYWFNSTQHSPLVYTSAYTSIPTYTAPYMSIYNYPMTYTTCKIPTTNSPNNYKVIHSDYFIKLYYNLAIINNNFDAYANLSKFYFKINNFDESKKYALLGANLNIAQCIFLLGDIYEKENNNQLAIETYLNELNQGYKHAYLKLIKLYLKLNDKDSALYYYIKGLENNVNELYNDDILNNFSDNPVGLYVQLSKINQPNKFILELLTKLSTNESVKLYVESVRSALANFDTDQKRKRFGNSNEYLMES
jgi:tetratricopeptide (TPR) repeat protein